jgi:DNA invertase Pin-like site-specific DNA recombinase
MPAQFVAYYRVSTRRQGRKGYSLDAQQRDILAYIERKDAKLCGEYSEIESGASTNRPKMKQAIADCKRLGACLLVARLDRLSRSLHFILQLMASKINFIIVDMPMANAFTIHIFAAIAEYERALFSARIKAAYVVSRKRGNTWVDPLPPGERREILLRGRDTQRENCVEFALQIAPIVAAIRKVGFSKYADIAIKLNELCIPTPYGSTWSDDTVRAQDRNVAGRIVEPLANLSSARKMDIQPRRQMKWSLARRAQVRQTALIKHLVRSSQFLAGIPNHEQANHSELAVLLNQGGSVTKRGKAWNRQSVRELRLELVTIPISTNLMESMVELVARPSPAVKARKSDPRERAIPGNEQ